MISRSSAALVVALSASSVACSSPSATKQPPGVDGGTVGCSAEGDTYTANLTRKGTLGLYTFTLVRSSPAPPAEYANVWTLKATDANGASPSASQLVVYPFMKLMGHGSDQTPTVTSNGDGTFTVKDVFLMMTGLWTVTVSVTEPPDGGPPTTTSPVTLDRAVYTFCIE